METQQKLYLKNIVERAIYQNFNEKERKFINMDYYCQGMVDCVEDALAIMLDEMKHRLSLLAKDPNEDSLELRESDSWY